MGGLGAEVIYKLNKYFVAIFEYINVLVESEYTINFALITGIIINGRFEFTFKLSSI